VLSAKIVFLIQKKQTKQHIATGNDNFF